MIIISENKKNHMLIKKFLLEAGDYDPESQYVGFFKAISDKNSDEDSDENDTVLDQKVINNDTPVTKRQINKISMQKPKMNKLKRIMRYFGAIIPMVTAAKYFDICDNADIKQSDIEKISRQIADANKNVEEISPEIVYKLIKADSVSEEKIIYRSLSEEQTNLDKAMQDRSYAGEGISIEDQSSLYNFEGFRSTPYPDAGGMSIGYGTQLFKNYSESKSTPWQKIFFEEKLGNKKCKEKNYVMRNGVKTQISDITDVTNKEAEKAMMRDLKKRQAKLESKDWFVSLPRDAQLSYLDMSYQMGLYFNMSKFKLNMRAAGESLKRAKLLDDETRNVKNKSDRYFIASSNQPEVIVLLNQAIDYLKSSIVEMKHFKSPDEKEYDNDTSPIFFSAYYLGKEKSEPALNPDGTEKEGHRRARNSEEGLNLAIQTLQDNIDLVTNKESTSEEERVEDAQNESKSLKSVYTNLFS